MFSGLIEETGEVKKIIKSSSGLKLGVKAYKIIDGIKPGDSISVNGVCLTVIESVKNIIIFDVVRETLQDTTLSRFRINEIVNLERALRADSRLGGHFVYGHIDTTAKIIKYSPRGITIRIPAEFEACLVPKASIAVDGISLTIQNVRRPEADIAVIPYTFQNTNLKTKRTGNYVNIEVDFMLKQVISLIKDNIHPGTEK